MTQTLFTRAARCLYGRDFLTDISEELGINQRTVQRWCNGSRFPPLAIWQRIAELIAGQKETQDRKSVV